MQRAVYSKLNARIAAKHKQASAGPRGTRGANEAIEKEKEKKKATPVHLP
jgi:hypothetical protein